mmetsp:Transcript_19910/g.76277  ORF Transcript_19910/g.76277 Transcript_19910/m.76277 type:complete len:482 (-) Transcript_19910:218-1663(-)
MPMPRPGGIMPCGGPCIMPGGPCIMPCGGPIMLIIGRCCGRLCWPGGGPWLRACMGTFLSPPRPAFLGGCTWRGGGREVVGAFAADPKPGMAPPVFPAPPKPGIDAALLPPPRLSARLKVEAAASGTISSSMASAERLPWLYLSLRGSPGLFLNQNFRVWSLEPEARMWPSGCQRSVQMLLSCAALMVPTGALWPTCQYMTEPSPPLQKSSSCTGCHATVLTMEFWPRNTCISFMVRRSNSMQLWSLPAVRSQLPFLLKETFSTVFLWLCSVARHLPAFGSQSLIMLSLPPLARRDFTGCQSTDFTSQPCPVSTHSSLARAKSHTRILTSSELDASFRSVGEKLSPRTASECALNAFTLFMLLSQYFTTPSLSPVTIHLSSWLHSIARTAESWACRIVSKLNVRPFQRVNWPMLLPVISLLPSGVHTMSKTGQRSLLIDVWMNFEQSEVMGLCLLYSGGMSFFTSHGNGWISSLSLSGCRL